MVTQTIHVGDCELLEYYMDVTDAANPKWRNWDDREWLMGLNGSATFPNPYTGQPGSTECVNGWRGLTPLALNPLFGTAGAGHRADGSGGDGGREVDALGRRAQRLRRPAGRLRPRPWDNVGVQYGLQALRDGHITPLEFLDLNAKVGQLEGAAGHGPGGLAVPAGRRRSTRGAPATCASARTAARRPRRAGSGDVVAMRNAYEKGLYFDGDIDIPIIDGRPYLEEVLDMHNSHQSFAARQRMLDNDGDASNQVIWFSGQQGGDRLMLPQAFQTIDEWMANLREHPRRGVAGNRPAAAVDSCFTATGDTIATGPRRVGGHPRPPRAGGVHEALPAPLDVAHRGRRPAARWRLQVLAAVRRAGHRPRSVRRLAADRGRARPARADLPRRRVRLHAGRRGEAARVLSRRCVL